MDEVITTYLPALLLLLSQTLTVPSCPDDSRIVDTGKGLLGFHRLSIMGLTPDGMQPFELDGSYAICNGELYGFEKLKKELSKKYTFKSGSDCEIILPMYREYGVDMFNTFEYSLCDGDEGVRYLESVKERGIRMSPPENGGYLTVRIKLMLKLISAKL